MKPRQDLPWTRGALANTERTVADFFGSLAAEEFVLRVGDAWTPAEHLAHLNTSVSAVARGFAVRRWLLRLRFGRSRRPSRTFEEFRSDYQARLDAGARATGPFIPDRDDPVGEQRAERQRELLARWQRVNDRLGSALASWGEADLERIRLPHPGLGMITAREMLFFTIHHGPHHVAAAKRRLPRFATSAR